MKLNENSVDKLGFLLKLSASELLLLCIIRVSLPPLPRLGSFCGAGGDGSSGCSLPVCGRPDSPHVDAAARPGWRGCPAGPQRQPGPSLSVPLQTRHQLQDHPLVSQMDDSGSVVLKSSMLMFLLFSLLSIFLKKKILIFLLFYLILWRLILLLLVYDFACGGFCFRVQVGLQILLR